MPKTTTPPRPAPVGDIESRLARVEEAIDRIMSLLALLPDLLQPEEAQR